MKLSIIFSTLFFSVLTQASDCLELVSDPNWTENKHQLVLSCEKTQNLVGASEYDKACFAISKLQYGNYKDTLFQTVRYSSESSGYLKTLVTVYANGSVVGDGQIIRKGQKLQMIEDKSSFEFNQSWTEQVTVNLEDPFSLKFDIYNKKLLRKKLSESSVYSCRRVL